ncbi:MAG TPA: sugar phosphate nucleotidyltransferase [Bryobacteraceae bacterium]|nr:sugar phosphate nucleotidyltransferase [Bryobacteraceae bacterium]
MKIRKAVITAAGRNQRTLPLQTLIDRDGTEKSVLRIIIEEVATANIDEICIVIAPGDEAAYTQAANDRASMIRYVPQRESLGYGHALSCARDFIKDDPFLHLVGDHLYVSPDRESCVRRLVQVAESQACAVSAVQATRESLLQHYGTVGGQRLPGNQGLYRIERVIEKPTPTEAEQKLIVSGLRVGHYLCFFGMHVLTPGLMGILERLLASNAKIPLSTALAELARREQYLAFDLPGRRYDVGVKYGLLRAQLALALSGCDRVEVLSQLVEALALRDIENTAGENTSRENTAGEHSG